MNEITIPNYQMKRYERIVQIQTDGMLQILGINLVLNVALFCFINYVIQNVYWDVTFDHDT